MEIKNSTYMLIVAVIIAAVVGFLFFPSLIPRNNLQLAQYIYKGMAEGRFEVVEFIQWDRFIAFGADVGAEFSQLPDEPSRISYAQALIRSFSNSVASAGGSVKDVSGWRLFSSDGGRVIIAADYPKRDQIVLFEIARVGGRRKLVSMSWGKEPVVPEE